MDELKDSSLLFSLEGLMETERERVRREAREAQEQREAEIKRVAAAAERRQQLSREQREARARREALAREQERFEQERIEALKQAPVERARIEAEAGLRLVEAEQARQHDLALSRLREEHGAARYRALAWLGTSALGLALGGALLLHFAWIAPAHARALRHAESRLRESSARSEATRLALAAEQSKTRALSAELERARAALVASHEPEHAAPKPPAPPSRRVPGAAGARRNCGDSGDPLDDCLR